MDYITLFITAFIVGLSGAMMPGPMLTVTISETPRRGPWVGPQLVLGHGIVEALLIIGLAAGLSRYLQQPAVTGSIGLVGGVVLLWFGWGIFMSARDSRVAFSLTGEGTIGQEGVQTVKPVLAGMLLSLTNPYWSLWWATIGAGYVVLAMNMGTAGLAVFFAGHILSDLAWFALVSFVIYTGRSLISQGAYRHMLMLCAVFLGLLGCWFAYDGLHKLMNVIG